MHFLDIHRFRIAWWLLQSSPAILASSLIAKPANAQPLEPPTQSEPEFSVASVSRDRLDTSSQTVSPTPTPPEVLKDVESVRSLPKASKSASFLTVVPPETIENSQSKRSVSEVSITPPSKTSSLDTHSTDLPTQPGSVAQTDSRTIPILRDRTPSPTVPSSSEPPIQSEPLPDLRVPSSSENPPQPKPKYVGDIGVEALRFDSSTVFKPGEIPEILKVEDSQATAREFQIYTPEEVKEKIQQWEKEKEKDSTLKRPEISTPLSSAIQNRSQFSLSELLRIADAVTRLYTERGYRTTGAVVCIIKDSTCVVPKENEVFELAEIQIIEGSLADIRINAKPDESPDKEPKPELPKSRKLRLNKSYIKSHLLRGLSTKPLNLDRLEENLRLLQLDPLIRTINARLSESGKVGESILDIQIEEAPTFLARTNFDNSRSPNIGSSQRQIIFEKANLLGGFGDRLALGYANTDGSDNWNVSYTIPWNSLDGTISFAYSGAKNQVIRPPFDDIDGDGDRSDIESNSSSYDLTIRQPIVRRIPKPKEKDGKTELPTYYEFALGLTASLRDSQTFLLDIPFPLSAGADDDGFTRVAALRFFQEWTKQNSREVLAFRSQFNFGLNAFGSTINEPGAELREIGIPDSQFFSWQGQAQWVRSLGNNDIPPFLVARANVQLADQGLLSSEQFAIGGFGSVRGYQQDALQTDNGLFSSVEVRLPIRAFARHFNRERGALQIIPFVDYGTGWNGGSRETPKDNTLLSIGLGVQWQFGLVDNRWGQLSARVDWGIPLISVRGEDNTRQENGLTFTLQWRRQF